MSEEVFRVAACDLRVADGAWEWAHHHAVEIDASWDELRRETPHFFNGVIYFMESRSLAGGLLTARFLQSDFKTFLYWRERGFPKTGVSDAFGSALIRSAEGHVILGRQGPGHINGGLAYLPGGFIDSRDVGSGGAIDIVSSIERELVEETGLTPEYRDRLPGFIVTTAGCSVSIAAEYKSRFDAAALQQKIRSYIAAQPDSELEDVVIVRSADDLRGLGMPPYARVLLPVLFPDERTAGNPGLDQTPE